MTNFIDKIAKESPRELQRQFSQSMASKMSIALQNKEDEVRHDFASTSEDPEPVLQDEEVEEECCGWVDCEDELTEEEIAERKLVVKVDSKGKRRKKIKCGPGKKLSNGRCVTQKSSEKIARKKGSRKATRKKKGKSQTQVQRKRKLALKKRKSMGL